MNRSGCLDDLFGRGRRRAEAPALVCGTQVLTYAEVEARANRLAHALRRRGVGPEVRVAIALDRSPQVSVSILAVLKAGGAWVPMDPAYPRDRLGYMLDNSGAALLVTEAYLLETLPAGGRPVLCLDRDASEVAAESGDPPTPRAVPGNLAYVMYTSGSTGRPKGVLCERGTVLEYARAIGAALRVRAADRYLHTASFAFSSSVRQLLVPLARGASSVLALRAQVADPLALLRWVRESRATVADVVPSYWQTLVYTLSRLDPAARATLLENHLRLVVSASEALPGTLPRAWREMGHRARVANLYGQTETTGITLVHRLGKAPPPPEAFVPVGAAREGARVHLLDASFSAVPPGAEGEIYVGGEGPARGYLGRPGLTAERFLPDPHPARPGARMYRTGDAGRAGDDGALRFVGRLDNRVKVGGVLVEVEEVEAALRRHPGIAECAVAACEPAPGDARLTAYVVLAEGAQSPSVHELRSCAGEVLPAPMIPGSFVAVAALPRTASGKVVRHAVERLAGRPLALSGAAVPPRNRVEEAVAEIWSEVLGGALPGVHDDFFALGGGSLLAMRVSARVSQRFGVELPLSVLFEHATVAALAAQVSAADGRTECGADAEPTGSGIPLTLTQERLWVQEQVGGGQDVIERRFRVRGPLDVAALRKAVAAVVARHEALRTGFVLVDGEPRQVVAASATAPVTLVDLQRLPPGAAATVRAPRMDLGRPPLFSTTVLRRGKDVHDICLRIHHLVSDAWSLHLFFQELGAFFAAAVQGGRAHVPELTIQPGGYALRQRRLLAGTAVDAARGYWRGRLEGADRILPYLADHPQHIGREGPLRASRLALDDKTSRELQELAGSQGATTFVALLALIGLLLRVQTGRADFNVLSYSAGRSWPGTDVLIGCFAEAWLLRLDASGNPSFRDLLTRIRLAVLGDIAQPSLELGVLTARAGALREAGQVEIAFSDHSPEPPRLAGLESEWLASSGARRAAGLHVGIFSTPLGLRGALEVNAELMDESTQRQVTWRFCTLAEMVVADPDASMSEVRTRLVAAEGRQQAQQQMELAGLVLQRLRGGSGSRRTLVN